MGDTRSCVGHFYARSTLERMTKAELIELLDIAQRNYTVYKSNFERTTKFLMEHEDMFEVVLRDGRFYELRLKER